MTWWGFKWDSSTNQMHLVLNSPLNFYWWLFCMSPSWACMLNSVLCSLSPSKSVCRSWWLCFCCPWMRLPGNPSSVSEHILLLISPGPHIMSTRRPCICLMLVSHHETLAAAITWSQLKGWAVTLELSRGFSLLALDTALTFLCDLYC